MVQQYNYDLLVVDWMLPKMNGIELCKKIRSHSTIAMIMLTAKGELSDKLEGFDKGFDDYLVKPFDLDELALTRRAWGVFRDRRPELYTPLLTQNGKDPFLK